jgi:hypothetical protein
MRQSGGAARVHDVEEREVLKPGAGNRVDFGSGLLRVRWAGVTNGAAFVVGNGTDAAEYRMFGGTNFAHTFADGLVIANNGSLTGSGRIASPTTVYGTLAPGGTTAVSNQVFGAALTFTSSGALNVQIGGTGQGSAYDYVNASGQSVDLGGASLVVTLASGYAPSRAATFTVLTGTLSGSFGNLVDGRVGVSGLSAAFEVDTSSGTSVVLKDYRYRGGSVMLLR